MKNLLAPVLLITSVSAQAQVVGSVCPPDIDSELTNLLRSSFPTENAKTVSSFKLDIQNLLNAKCDAKLLSKDDIRAIVDAADIINELDPAVNTNSSYNNAINIIRYVKYGIPHATEGACTSDLGVESALRHCVCTQVSINELLNRTVMSGEPDCR